MECKGRFPVKMLKKGRFATNHFDVLEVGGEGSVQFYETVRGSALNTHSTKRIKLSAKPSNDIKSCLLSESEKRRMRASSSDPEQEIIVVQNLVDLLDKMLTLNPERRPTVREALSHPFFASQI